jgi:hypothetical protein
VSTCCLREPIYETRCDFCARVVPSGESVARVGVVRMREGRGNLELWFDACQRCAEKCEPPGAVR